MPISDDHHAATTEPVQAGAEPVDEREGAEQREPEGDVLEAHDGDDRLEADRRERADRGEQRSR